MEHNNAACLVVKASFNASEHNVSRHSGPDAIGSVEAAVAVSGNNLSKWGWKARTDQAQHRWRDWSSLIDGVEVAAFRWQLLPAKKLHSLPAGANMVGAARSSGGALGSTAQQRGVVS